MGRYLNPSLWGEERKKKDYPTEFGPERPGNEQAVSASPTPNAECLTRFSVNPDVSNAVCVICDFLDTGLASSYLHRNFSTGDAIHSEY